MTEETQAPGVVFNIQKIYVKDASYEAPNVPAVFLDQQAAPQVELRMDVGPHGGLRAAVDALQRLGVGDEPDGVLGPRH